MTTSSDGLSAGTYLGNNGQPGILWGTFTNNTFSGSDDGGSIVEGTVTGDHIVGTWRLIDEHGTEVTGDLEASECY